MRFDERHQPGRRIDRALTEDRAHGAHLTPHGGQESGTGVFKEMPPIRDLQSFWTPLRRRAIAAAD